MSRDFLLLLLFSANHIYDLESHQNLCPVADDIITINAMLSINIITKVLNYSDMNN